MKNKLIKYVSNILLLAFWVGSLILIFSYSFVIGCAYFLILLISVFKSQLMRKNLKIGKELINMDQTYNTKVLNLVSKISHQAGIPMPTVVVVENSEIQARSIKDQIYISTGAIVRLDTKELEYVIAHEIGHIEKENFYYNLLIDVLGGFSTNIIYWGMNGKSNIKFIVFLITFPFVLISFLLTVLINRQREFICDRYAIKLLNKKEPMESFINKKYKDTEAENNLGIYPSKSERLNNIEKL